MSSTIATQPALSVIVPAHNAAPMLDRCLAATRSAAKGLDVELIVVDDASEDDSALVARRHGARLLQVGRNRGPAFVRNLGAEHASAPILCFVDADVVVSPGSLERVLNQLDEDKSLAAVFGSYDSRPAATGLVSQYRNLLHHYTHQNGRPQATSFWAGFGAIRADAFFAVNGFDADNFAYAIEDIDLGYRLVEAGYRIKLDPALQCTHLKRWTLWSMIRTDVLSRALPWARLIQSNRPPAHDLNIKMTQKVSVVLSLLLLASGIMGLFDGRGLAVTLVAFMAYLSLNGRWFGFLRRQRGLSFALSCIPLHLLHHGYSGCAYLWVWLERRLPARA